MSMIVETVNAHRDAVTRGPNCTHSEYMVYLWCYFAVKGNSDWSELDKGGGSKGAETYPWVERRYSTCLAMVTLASTCPVSALTSSRILDTQVHMRNRITERKRNCLISVQIWVYLSMFLPLWHKDKLNAALILESIQAIHSHFVTYTSIVIYFH